MQERIEFEKKRLFHNTIVFLYRFGLLPRPVVLLLCLALPGAAALLWPAHGGAAFLAAGFCVLLEALVIETGNLRGTRPGPLGGPLLVFSAGHAAATLAVGLLPFSPPRLVLIHLLVQAGLFFAMLYGSLVEPFKVQWREVMIEVSGKDDAAAPGPGRARAGPGDDPGEGPGLVRELKLLLLTDLHLDRRGSREEQALALAARFQPDLIAWPGDFTNLSFVGDEVTREQTREFLRELCRLAPVYASRGTKEVDRKWWVESLFAGTPAVLLDDEAMEAEFRGVKLLLAGVSFAGPEKETRRRLREVLGRADSDSRLVLLLLHSPDLVEEAAALGVDLYLAGHTHGGQVRLPFFGPLYTASRYGRRFAEGVHRVKGLTLVVSRGMGMEGAGAPRVRFLCPPEVVGIKLVVKS